MGFAIFIIFAALALVVILADEERVLCTPFPLTNDFTKDWTSRSQSDHSLFVVVQPKSLESSTDLSSSCSTCGPMLNLTVQIQEILSPRNQTLVSRGELVTIITGAAVPCGYPQLLLSDPAYFVQIAPNTDHFQLVSNQWNRAWSDVTSEQRAVIKAGLPSDCEKCCVPAAPFDDAGGACAYSRGDGFCCATGQSCCREAGGAFRFSCCSESNELCNDAETPAPADQLPLVDGPCYVPKACADDRKTCPNGMGVARVFPKCLFPDCPGLQECGSCCRDSCEPQPGQLLDFSKICCPVGKSCCPPRWPVSGAAGACCDDALFQCEAVATGGGGSACYQKRDDSGNNGGGGNPKTSGNGDNLSSKPPVTNAAPARSARFAVAATLLAALLFETRLVLK